MPSDLIKKILKYILYPLVTLFRTAHRKGILTIAALFLSVVSFSQYVSGDYKTVLLASGNWSDNTKWEKYDGSSWLPSSDYPGASAGNPTVFLEDGAFISMDLSPANSIKAITFLSNSNDAELIINGATLNLTGAITFSIPSVISRKQSIDIGTGAINCGAVSMVNTLAASKHNEILISTGILNVTGNISMQGTSDRNYIIASGNSIINVGGDITGGGFTCSTSTVNYNGINQNIGSYTYNNLTISGGGTKSLTGVSTINGTLTLTSGNLRLGNFDLTITNVIPVAGSFSATTMVESSGAGHFIRSANATNESFNLTYPIGSGGFYNPLIISGLPAGAAAARTMSVRAEPSDLGILSNTIMKYWDLDDNNTLTTNGSTVLSFQFNIGEVIGDPLLFQPFNDVITPGVYTLAANPSFPGSNPSTSTGTTKIKGSWTIGSSSTFYSYQTGNWNQTSTWTFDPGGTTGPGTSLPGFNDKVVILSGRTVTLTANVTAQDLDITINNGGIIDMSARAFTNTLVALRGSGILKLASSQFPTATLNSFVTTDGGTQLSITITD